MVVKLKDPLTAEAGVGGWATEVAGIDATAASPARRLNVTMTVKERRLRMAKSSYVALTMRRWPEGQTSASMPHMIITLSSLVKLDRRRAYCRIHRLGGS